ncbi:MAG TPA: twin-arginine translocation signal domain-containing protein, partial [Bryobacterales bacterium]|nr:twin-arginine translocation signal domain-containing protein [Bryobacterales bacterium]
MDRRKFLSVSGTAAGAAALAGCGETAPTGGEDQAAVKKEMKPMPMHVGTQRRPTNPEMLQYVKRHGVSHVCGYPPRPPDD